MLLKLFCLAVVLANGENNHRIYAYLPTATEGIETILQFWFLKDAEFNESCVSEGCPALNNFSLCPNEIDIIVLYAFLNTAVDCMRKPICGILIDMRPTPSLPISTDQWLPKMEISGTFTTISGTGYLTNVSNIEFGLLSSQNQTHQLPLSIPMFITKMRCFGNFKLDLSSHAMSHPIFGQPLSVTIPQAQYEMEIQYISTIFINRTFTDNYYSVKLLNPMIKTQPSICGLDLPGGFPSIQTLFTSMSKVLTENSAWAVINAAFLEKYFQSAIRTVSNSC